MTGFFRRLKDVWMIAGVTVLFLVLVEVAFMVYYRFNESSDPGSQADCYENAEWVNEYYKELKECNHSEWEPFVYWSRKPFNGEYININRNGNRKSALVKHPFSKDDPQTKIFYFGGSSVWGMGVRDEYTIPSISGMELSKKGYNIAVTNFGESGYVSSQDLIRLMIELNKENVPDIVVFYGGINDILSGLQNGKAGIPLNENHRKREFNSLVSKKKSFLNLFYSLRTLATVRFITSNFSTDNYSWEYTDDQLDSLIQVSVKHYNENVRLVNALGKQYGFKSIFYWQPSIFYKSVLSQYEKTIVKNKSALKKVMEKVNTRLYPDDLVYDHIRFYNLTYLFSNETDPVYIGWNHVGEKGNILVSRRIVKDLMPLVDQKYEGNTRFDEQN